MLIGDSGAFKNAMRLLAKIAPHDAPVLIEGETGTGKELAARAIHYQGRRRDFPFVAVNCGAIPDSLIENELFGHDRGAFTDARLPGKGLIECAHGGTLFLDEVDALTPKAQVTLLRFLQDRQYRPLGSARDRQADVRVIAATNADLRSLCEARQFRTDLFYRLCILELHMPPLRDRHGDPALLAGYFAARLAPSGRRPPSIGAETLGWFASYHWPGNVRELENVVCRAVLMADDSVVEILPPNDQAESQQLPANAFELSYAKAKAIVVDRFEKRYLASILAKAHGNVTLAARLAGKERRALGKLMKKHSLDRNAYRQIDAGAASR